MELCVSYVNIATNVLSNDADSSVEWVRHGETGWRGHFGDRFIRHWEVYPY